MIKRNIPSIFCTESEQRSRGMFQDIPAFYDLFFDRSTGHGIFLSEMESPKINDNNVDYLGGGGREKPWKKNPVEKWSGRVILKISINKGRVI
jgi:hypothetical protein